MGYDVDFTKFHMALPSGELSVRRFLLTAPCLLMGAVWAPARYTDLRGIMTPRRAAGQNMGIHWRVGDSNSPHLLISPRLGSVAIDGNFEMASGRPVSFSEMSKEGKLIGTPYSLGISQNFLRYAKGFPALHYFYRSCGPPGRHANANFGRKLELSRVLF